MGKKGAASSSGSKDGGGKGDKLGTCKEVKCRHILCEKQSKALEAYQKMREGWLDNDDKVPPAEFGKLAMQYSECSSGKKGGDLGWFPRGKMEGKFQEIAFALQAGQVSDVFKGANGYHIILCEGRRN
mmetsp:Transcript_9635/g.16655  ORF Transcript_9635/g.16655 Transcript_9635/m.16655 type:complete len:128 (+) Transcript_9635:29-412(+)